jgi:hypothetical protein
MISKVFGMGWYVPFSIPSEELFSLENRRVYDTSLADEKLLKVIKIVIGINQ